jgi:hypothetical protein
MLEALRSLDMIASEYTFFEKDQVLTHSQLNGLVEYLDDQDRLTRVSLIGVGICCGLRVVSLDARRIRVTKGVAVTTDGDLLRLTADTEFDRFKPYGDGAPVYKPLMAGDTMVPAFELLRADAPRDDRSSVLAQFGAQDGRKLGDMVAVLFMESYLKDDDLCEGDDCDNLGQRSVYTLRLLLVDKATVPALLKPIPTPRDLAAVLTPVVAARVLMPAGTSQVPAVQQQYLAACDRMHTDLLKALPAVFPAARGLLDDTFSADPSAEWRGRLEKIRTQFQADRFGVQYYYDFLKDVVETYNAFVARLFDDMTVCLPSVDAFPKHVVLGIVVPGQNRDENRTAFYPAPSTSSTRTAWAHAERLAAKLNTLIRSFRLPGAQAGLVRITPSRFEDWELELRAIPYYYGTGDPFPVHRTWNHQLSRRGRDADNYSYSAADYGGPVNPLAAPIGGLPFFRIEGHQGKGIGEVVPFLNGEIKARNLPFTVRPVLVSANKKKIVVDPSRRYTDLDRFQLLLRTSVANQLDDLTSLSDSLKAEVENAVLRKDIVNVGGSDTVSTARTMAAEKSRTVTQKATSAKAMLAANNGAWKQEMHDAAGAAADFKFQLTTLAKTEFLAPVDSIVASPHVAWLEWLDTLIATRNDNELTRVLFADFIAQNPGVEHFAGVIRGGTFVIAYDEAGTIVADFMLPYYCPAPNDDATEPPLPRPTAKPPWFVDGGIRVLPRPEATVNTRMDAYVNRVDELAKVVDYSKGVTDILRSTVFTTPASGQPSPGTGPVNTGPTVPAGPAGPTVPPRRSLTDPLIESRVRAVEVAMDNVDKLRKASLDPTLTDPKRAETDAMAKRAEIVLARAISDAGGQVASKGADMTPGADGNTAMTVISDGLTRISDKEALTEVRGGFDKLVASPQVKPEIRSVVSSLRGRVG